MDATMWPTNWPHEAPDGPLSVAESHQTMQRHLTCLREDCPRKSAAYMVLVAAGRMVPDSGRV